MDKFIISVAVTGSRLRRDQTPYAPITPEEIAASVVEAWREGAAIAHLHLRDDQGQPTADVATCARVMKLIRDAGCDVVINLTTGAGGGTIDLDRRLDPVRVRPEMASFDVGSLNFNDWVFLNPPDFLERLASLMKEMGVKPEIECFDTGMIFNGIRLIEKGLIDPPYWFQFVLGIRGGAQPTAKQLVHMRELIPAGALWSLCAIGRDQLPMNVMAIAMGGHARTGLEDNLYYRKGEFATNAKLVARLVRIARECGREPASPDDARSILGISRP